MGALSIQGIHKTYNETTHILKGIDLEIEAGEFLILVGPSGCGKSTLLSMIAGLDHPTEGRILIGDRDVTHLPSKDRDIAMVFQSYALYPHMTVQRNIESPLLVRSYHVDGNDKPARKLSKAERDERVAEAARGRPVSWTVTTAATADPRSRRTRWDRVSISTRSCSYISTLPSTASCASSTRVSPTYGARSRNCAPPAPRRRKR